MLCSVALMLALPSLPAGAHAGRVASSPEHGESVAAPPKEVSIEFSEAVRSAKVEVFDARGESVHDGDAFVDPSNPRLVNVPLKNMSRGVHTVRWEVLSTDGHTTKEDFYFHVGTPSRYEQLLRQHASESQTFSGRVDGIDVTVLMAPARVGMSAFEVSTHQLGKPLNVADVSMFTYQSDAGIYLPEYRLEPTGEGRYGTVGAFTVPGLWQLRLTFLYDGAVKSIRFEVPLPEGEASTSTGESSAAGASESADSPSGHLGRSVHSVSSNVRQSEKQKDVQADLMRQHENPPGENLSGTGAPSSVGSANSVPSRPESVSGADGVAHPSGAAAPHGTPSNAGDSHVASPFSADSTSADSTPGKVPLTDTEQNPRNTADASFDSVESHEPPIKESAVSVVWVVGCVLLLITVVVGVQAWRRHRTSRA